MSLILNGENRVAALNINDLVRRGSALLRGRPHKLISLRNRTHSSIAESRTGRLFGVEELGLKYCRKTNWTRNVEVYISYRDEGGDMELIGRYAYGHSIDGAILSNARELVSTKSKKKDAA